MKYIVILCDGMADEPIDRLDGKTPLEAARTPNMDRLAKNAEIGMARTVPEGMAPGSDTANLSVIGYDPRKYYSGRSPLEALSIGADMGKMMCLSGVILSLCRREKSDTRIIRY